MTCLQDKTPGLRDPFSLQDRWDGPDGERRLFTAFSPDRGSAGPSPYRASRILCLSAGVVEPQIFVDASYSGAHRRSVRGISAFRDRNPFFYSWVSHANLLL